MTAGLFFAAILALALVGLAVLVLLPAPRVTFGDRGILDRSLGLGWVHWDEIDGAWMRREDRGEHLVLRVRVSPRLLPRLRRRSHVLGGAAAPETVDLHVDLAGTGIASVDIVREIVGRTGADPGSG